MNLGPLENAEFQMAEMQSTRLIKTDQRTS